MAQVISYEVRLIFIVMRVVILSGSYDFENITIVQGSGWFVLVLGPLAWVWFVSCLAETNRTPFDFAEGESELVSGFNVEYGSFGFAFIFIAEYGVIIFMSCLLLVLFFGGTSTAAVLGWGVIGL